MSSNKRGTFPKITKKIKNFLTDESWKITKKDALGISTASVVLLWAQQWFAWHSQVYTSVWNRDWRGEPSCAHVSGVINGHFSQTLSVSGHHEWNKELFKHSSHGSHWSHGSHGFHGSRW